MNTLSLSEEMPAFHKYAPLNQPLETEEAIKKLAYYHNSNRESILKSFMNLRENIDNTKNIQFSRYSNSGTPSLLMEGFNDAGNRIWFNYIDPLYGNPQNFCS